RDRTRGGPGVRGGRTERVLPDRLVPPAARGPGLQDGPHHQRRADTVRPRPGRIPELRARAGGRRAPHEAAGHRAAARGIPSKHRHRAVANRCDSRGTPRCPRVTPPSEGTTMNFPDPGTLAWFEVATSDPDAAEKFYGGLFDWSFQADGPAAS